VDANVRQRDGDQNVRHRFSVTRDSEHFRVRHRGRVVAEQFSTAGDRDRFRLLIRMFDGIHGAPQTASGDDRAEWVGALGRVDL
jgi:hypothetical protein